MNTLLTFIHVVPTADWVALGAWLATSGGQSFMLQILKHFNPKIVDNVAFALHSFLTLATAIVAFIVASPQLQVVPTVGKYWAILMGLTTLWYRFVTSPAYKSLTTLISDAQKYRQITAAQPTSAAAPARQQFGE